MKARELADAGETDMEKFIREVIEHAEYVLSQTPEMLPVLKQAGVVDSGGQGLIEVLHGSFDAFLGKEIDFSISEPAQSSSRPVCRECQPGSAGQYGNQVWLLYGIYHNAEQNFQYQAGDGFQGISGIHRRFHCCGCG